MSSERGHGGLDKRGARHTAIPRDLARPKHASHAVQLVSQPARSSRKVLRIGSGRTNTIPNRAAKGSRRGEVVCLRHLPVRHGHVFPSWVTSVSSHTSSRLGFCWCCVEERRNDCLVLHRLIKSSNHARGIYVVFSCLTLRDERHSGFCL